MILYNHYFKKFSFNFVPSGSRRFHGGFWCRTGRAGGRWSFPAHLHRSAGLGASQASGVPRVPLGDCHRTAGEEQPQCECHERGHKSAHSSFLRHCLTMCGFHQGEALETVTTAAVCLFSTQGQLADQVPPLGHLPRILAALNHKNNAVPKSSIRLLHVLSENEVRKQIKCDRNQRVSLPDLCH